MNHVLKMSFLTDTGEIATVNIPNPFLGVDDSEVKDAMTRIIDSNAMVIKNALLVKPNSAELMTATKKEFDI